MKGLYVHIPFCVQKCSYCDFYSLPARHDTIESYVQAVLREANAYSPSFVRRDLKGELSIQNPPQIVILSVAESISSFGGII